MKLEYGSPSIDNEGKIHLTKFELKTGEYLRVMWSIFHYYETKGSIELDSKIVRSTKDILKMLKCPT